MAAPSHPALSAFLSALADPYAQARAFKQSGGRVVGYMTANAPVELIEAAGMYPLRLDGAGVHATPTADGFMEGLFDPTVRGVCELLMTGKLPFVDALILPRTADSVQRLYYYLCEQQRSGFAGLPQLIFYDLLHTPFYSSAEHNFASLTRVRDALSGLAGKAISDAALVEAISASNQRRESLARCLSADLTGVERLALVGACERMPGREFVKLAADVPVAVASRAPWSGTRLILAGNAPDSTDIHAAIEAEDCRVVGDFHDRNGESLSRTIDVTLPPARALSDHYHRATLSPRSFPALPERLAEFAAARRADGVIFFYYAQEEVLTWDYPAERDLLASRGLKSICLAGQPYNPDASPIRSAVAPFIAALQEAKR